MSGKERVSKTSRRAKRTRRVQAMARTEKPRVRFVESLEPRLVLASIPILPSIDQPDAVPQTVFATGLTVESHSQLSDAAGHLERFTIDGPGYASNARFQFDFVSPGSQSDAAIAVYDSSGNLVASADDDAVAGSESVDLTLINGEVYILGVFTDPESVNLPFQLTASTLTESTNSTIGINESGIGMHSANSGDDLLVGATDVDFFPLDLTNAADDAVISVSPTGSVGGVFAAIFRRDNPNDAWNLVAAEGSDSSIELNVAALSGQWLTDDEFMLVVTSNNFAGGPTAHDIAVATSVLSDASVDPATASPDVMIPTPVGLGISVAEVSDASTVGSLQLYEFFAVTDGTANISIESNMDVALSIYDSTGDQLLAVVTNPTNYELDILSGETHLLGVTPIQESGSFSLRIDTQFSPTMVPLVNNQASVAGITVGSGQVAEHYRVETNNQDDVLVLQLSPAMSAELDVVVVSNTMQPVQATNVVGQPLVLPIDIATSNGPFDIFVMGKSSVTTATLQFGTLDIPRFLPLSAFEPAELDGSGDILATESLGNFGSMAGFRYSELLRHTTGSGTTFGASNGTGTLTTGAVPTVARYAQQGNQFKLASFALPDSSGASTLYTTSNLTPEVQFAAAAFNLSLNNTGSVQIGLDGEAPIYVGVQMVPDLLTANPPVNSIFSVRGIRLKTEADVDLWKTILPFNIQPSSPTPTIHFEAADNDLQVRLQVWLQPSEGNSPTGLPVLDQLISGTQNLALPSMPIPRGHRAFFHVQAEPGFLGSGEYTLELRVDTTDPEPHLIQEEVFYFVGEPAPVGTPTPTQLPVNRSGVVDVFPNQFGNGAAQGTLTGGIANSAGSVDVYRFWAVTPGPTSVRTIGLSEEVNTNLRLYASKFDTNGAEYLQLIDAGDALGDWYPADRSEIDDQVYINNFEPLLRDCDPLVNPGSCATQPVLVDESTYETGGGYFYVVVESEQGTEGDYRIEFDAQTFPLLGDGNSFDAARHGQVIHLPADDIAGTTSISIDVPYVLNIDDFTGVYPVQMPEFHNGTLEVIGDPNAFWLMQLYDSNGTRLPGSVTQLGRTEAQFSVPTGSQTVYFMLHEFVQNTDPSRLGLSFSTTIVPPFGVFPPANSISPATVRSSLATDPSGSSLAPHLDNFTAAGQVKRYGLQLPAGESHIIVAPEINGTIQDVELSWSVHVDQQLWAWSDTFSTNTLDGTDLSFSLPTIRPPLESQDFDYDRTTYHDVVIVVESQSAPVNGGNFSISVDSQSQLPMQHSVDLQLDPLALFPLATSTSDGNRWTRLGIPDGALAPPTLHLELASGPVPGTNFEFKLYDTANQLIQAGTAVSGLNGQVGVDFSLAAVEDGHDYYLRAGVLGDVNRAVQMELSGTYPKNALFPAPFARPPAIVDASSLSSEIRMASEPNGDFTKQFVGTTAVEGIFWVGKGGITTVSANLGSGDQYLALYRIRADISEPGATVYSTDLVDFVNGLDAVAGQYSLSTHVEPGAYYIKAFRDGATSDVTLLANNPSFVSQRVVLEPNSGGSNKRETYGVFATYNAFGQSVFEVLAHQSTHYLPIEYRTSIFAVESPVGTQSTVSVEAVNLNENANLLDSPSFTKFYNATGTLGDAYIDIDLVELGETGALFADYTMANAVETYWIGFYGATTNSNFDPIGVGFDFDVPESGVPDLVVEPITLSPNDGSTQVGITIRNEGYGSAGSSASRYRYSNTTESPATWTASALLEISIGPKGTRYRYFDWIPAKPSDEVEYFVDILNTVPELEDFVNNEVTDVLSRVDPNPPQLLITLNNGNRDGYSSDATTFGRYITGVEGVTSNVTFSMSDPDGISHVFEAVGSIPQQTGLPNSEGQFYVLHGSSESIPYDFGSLLPTTAQNPNEFDLVPRDIYGLPGERKVVTAIVKQFPGWLLGANGEQFLTFNASSHRYEIDYRNALLDIGSVTLDELLGEGIPFIGDQTNRLLAEVGAEGSASLDPTAPLILDVYAHAEIKILGRTIFDETLDGTPNPSSFLSLTPNLVVNQDTLDTDFLSITFAINKLPLFNYQSPEITLFAYGIPDVASISANLQFSLTATLDAAVSVGFDTNTPFGSPASVGLVSPTYVAPTVTAGLSISGDIELLGFDIASLTGSIYLGITPAYGLESPPTQLVGFDDFFDNDCLQVTGLLYGNIAAEVLGFEVFSFDLPSVELPIPNNCSVVGARPSGGGVPYTTTFFGGDALVGELSDLGQPQLVIDPLSGQAHYLQLVDIEPDPEAVRHGLSFSRRANSSSGWTAPVVLPDSNQHVANAALALTHDGPGSPAVVAYQTLPTTGDPAALTRNQFLTGQDLAYRYFDGTLWGSPIALTSNVHNDAAHALAFNSTGQGGAVWVRNTNVAPLDAQGRFARADNEIVVSVWNPLTHSFGIPTTLTSNATSDSEPVIHTAADGTMIVAWLQDTMTDSGSNAVLSNQVMFSTFDPLTSNWSTAAPLLTAGLPSDGKVRNLAIGSHNNGVVELLIAHAATNSTDQSVQSTLFHRSSSASTFGQQQPVQVVAENLNFDRLQTTNAPDGSLVAYWMGGDSQQNHIFAASLNVLQGAASGWSRPFALTAQDADELPFSPSLAVDVNGEYQLVYELRTHAAPPFAPPPEFGDFPILPGHPDGDPAFEAPTSGNVASSSYAQLPEFGFGRPFTFAYQTTSVSGGVATGSAMVKNSGLADGRVTIEYVVETGPGAFDVLATRDVYLSAGQTLEVSHEFPVVAGENTFGIRLVPDAAEMIGAGNNESLATLTGAVDLRIASMVLSDPFPNAGDTINVQVELVNDSNLPANQVEVALWLGDPAWQVNSANLLNNIPIPGGTIGPGQSTFVNFSWTMPAEPRVYPLTAVVRSVSEEVTFANNSLTKIVRSAPEIAVGEVTATILNFSGVDNVNVIASVRNDGNSVAENVTFQLLYRLDDGSYSVVDSVFFSAMAAGQQTNVSFMAPGLAGISGENRYRVVSYFTDLDPGNQLGETLLYVQGLADLNPVGAQLDTGSPVQDQPTNLTVNIQNLGIATAQYASVEVFATVVTSGARYLIGTQTIDTMAPLSSAALSIPIDTRQVNGLTEFCVVVDRLQNILELTDFNNQDCFCVTVASAVAKDYGDAPENYPVFLEDDGARHEQAGDLTLGTDIDFEFDGQPSGGDNSNGINDETGVTFLSQMTPGGIFDVEVVVRGSQSGFLTGWIDFNGDGDWDDVGEQIFTDIILSQGVHVLPISVPAGAQVGATHARFRFSTQAGLTPRGRAPDGEVEDYALSIGTPTAGDFDGDSDVDADDIDLLCAQLASGSSDLTYDLNGDGQVGTLDVDELVLNIIGTFYGDANLDFSVDGRDFLIWNANKFQKSTGWATGDFNCDVRTDGADFAIWSMNKFRTAPGPGKSAVTTDDIIQRTNRLTAQHDPARRSAPTNRNHAAQQDLPREFVELMTEAWSPTQTATYSPKRVLHRPASVPQVQDGSSLPCQLTASNRQDGHQLSERLDSQEEKTEL